MGVATGLLALAVMGADASCPATADSRPAVAYAIPWDEIPAMAARFQALTPRGFAPQGWRRAKSDDAVQQASAGSPSSSPRGDLLTLTLRQAVGMSLRNSASMRVEDAEAPAGAGCTLGACCAGAAEAAMVVSPASAGTHPKQHRIAVEVLVSMVEEQYWKLAQEHVRLWSGELAVRLAEEVHRRERTALEAGHGTVADAAETAQRLEQLRLDLLTAAADANRRERWLRALLGLNPRDGRRIIPVSAPVTTHVVVDETAALRTAEVHALQILEQRTRIAQAATRYVALQGGPRLISGFVPCAALVSTTADATRARAELAREEAQCDQLVRETAVQIARYCFEAEAGYEQMTLAARLRKAAAHRLETQRASYELGQITIDRYLDAIGQYTSAVAQEGRFQGDYNIALAALEDQKGTQLASLDIRLAEPPRACCETEARLARNSDQVDPAVVRAGAEVKPEAEEASRTAAASPAPAPLTIKLDLTFGRSNPVQIRGSVSILRGR